MTSYLHALCWALAILGIAALNAAGAIADGPAQALFATLPILAVLSITQRRGCVRQKAG